jgi:hypothetical protein
MEIVMKAQLRRFVVVDPSTTVHPSQDGRHILSLDAEGGQVFRWAGGYFERVDIPTLSEAAGGAFRCSQFGSSEVAVICGDKIRRFGLRMNTAELPSLAVPGVSALAYFTDGMRELLIAGTVAGDIFVYDIKGEPELMERFHVCDQPIGKLEALNFGETLSVLTEGWQCWNVSLTDFNSFQVELEEVCAFAHCHESLAAAAADRTGALVVCNGETDGGWKLELNSNISNLCFVSATQLGVAHGNQVEMIHLDRLQESEGSQECELSPAQADGFIFIDGVLTPVYSQLLTRSESKYRELVLPYGQKIWGLGRDSGELVVIYE